MRFGTAGLRLALFGGTCILALGAGEVHGQTSEPTTGSVQRQLEQLRLLIERQQRMIGDLEQQVRELQGQQTRNQQAIQATDRKADETRKTVVDKPLITSSSPRVKLAITGQIDRLLNTANDGKSTKFYFVDNNISVSRLRFTATGQVTDDLSLGADVELGISPNNSNQVSQTNEQQASGDQTFEERKVEAVFKSATYGTVLFGRGDPATKDIARLDLSGTDVLAYTSAGDIAGGLFFRTDDGDDDLTGVQIKNVFTDFDSSRQDRIRYDTPAFHGAVASVSGGADQTWGAALRWAGEGHGVSATAGLGVQNPNENGIDNVYAGSASVLHDGTGLSLTLGSAVQDQNEGTGQTYYVKGGWQHKFFDFGATAFSIDYGMYYDTPNSDDEGRTIGAVALQNISRYGTQLFAGVRGYDFDQSDGPDTSTIYVGTVGTRVKF